MAKLGSSSCRPLLVQGMMLLAVLLLASIQAGPVMASWEQAAEAVEQAAEAAKQLLGQAGKEAQPHIHAPEVLHDEVENGAEKFPTSSRFCQKPALERACKGGKMGLRVHKYLCKAQGLVDKQNPGGASGTPFEILLYKSFPIFYHYYDVTSQGSDRGNSVVTCWSAVQPQRPAAGTLYQITGIRVDQVDVVISVQTPAYLSTEYTYLERDSLYGRLREVVILEMLKLNLGKMHALNSEADELCYASAAPLRLPHISILLARGNGVWNCSS